MLDLLPALVIGLAAGLRSFTPLAAVGLAARAGWLNLAGSPLALFGAPLAAYGFAALAAAELVADKLPQIPSRTAPGPFAFRISSGAVAGAAVATGLPLGGLIAGAVGAVAGTLGGHAGRAALARAFRHDLPAALIEDAIALCAALFAVSAA